MKAEKTSCIKSVYALDCSLALARSYRRAGGGGAMERRLLIITKARFYALSSPRQARSKWRHDKERRTWLKCTVFTAHESTDFAFTVLSLAAVHQWGKIKREPTSRSKVNAAGEGYLATSLADWQQIYDDEECGGRADNGGVRNNKMAVCCQSATPDSVSSSAHLAQFTIQQWNQSETETRRCLSTVTTSALPVSKKIIENNRSKRYDDSSRTQQYC